MSAPLRLEHDGPLAVVTFDSPPVNLFDEAMGEALSGALDQLEADVPRGVLFRAEGRLVSGGVDVNLFDAQPDVESAVVLWERLLELPHRIEALPCPTVFAAHGLCLTWAFELALACDLILAAQSAGFGLVEKVVGLTPAMGGTQRLAERAGSGRAREFVMTGDRYDAATLERWNVVNRVLPDENFDAAARAFARELSEGPTLAHAATKQVIRHYLQGGVELADAQIAGVAGGLFGTADLRGAVRSFLSEGPGKATFRGA
jgi:enoyl-CoA hydratase/carnithine racemase